jgi:23S rRNA G2445 N2-methylase RlmL
MKFGVNFCLKFLKWTGKNNLQHRKDQTIRKNVKFQIEAATSSHLASGPNTKRLVKAAACDRSTNTAQKPTDWRRPKITVRVVHERLGTRIAIGQLSLVPKKARGALRPTNLMF